MHNTTDSSSNTNVTDLHLPLPPLAERYRIACSHDLELISTFLRHPIAARRSPSNRLDHTFSLPDGYSATVRTSRFPVPRALVKDLAQLYPEYADIGQEAVFMFSVAIRTEGNGTIGVVGNAARNRHELQQRHRQRSVAQALHHARDRAYIYENGTDSSLPGLRFSWIGTRQGRPLPAPAELFVPKKSAA